MPSPELPDCDGRGMLPPGDHPLTFEAIRRSWLVVGPPGRADWDAAWRGQLVANLEHLARQLWRVGVGEIYVGGSFVEDRPRPADVDGYFVCDRTAYKTRALHQALNALDPCRPWTWRQEHRRPDPDGHLRIPLWHHYRVELFPYYGQPIGGFVNRTGAPTDYPTFYRHSRDDEPKGVVRLLPSDGGA